MGFLKLWRRYHNGQTVLRHLEALRIEASFQGESGLDFGGWATYLAKGVGVVKQAARGVLQAEQGANGLRQLDPQATHPHLLHRHPSKPVEGVYFF